MRYRLSETVQEHFLRLPYALYADKKYQELSNDARVIYSLLLDRLTLSIKNEWTNDSGEVYLIYPREAVAERLRMSRKKVIAAMKELRDVDLIQEERQGRGIPNRIFVLHTQLSKSDAATFETDMQETPEYDTGIGESADFSKSSEIALQEVSKKDFKESQNGTSRSSETALQEVPKTDFKKSQKRTSRSPKTALQEVPKRHPIYTDINQTDINQTEGRKRIAPSLENPPPSLIQKALSSFSAECPSLTQPLPLPQWPEKQLSTTKQQLTQLAGMGYDLHPLFFKAEASDFLTGRAAGYDGQTFIATFSWVTRPDNAFKIMSGIYDNRTFPAEKGRPSFDLDAYERDSLAKFTGAEVE
jgi:biotin operon repressor